MIKRARHTVGRGLTRLGRRFGYVRTEGFQFRPFRTSKVFCVGRNKTGTTSLDVALRELGYLMGDQREAEWLIDAYAARDFKPIVEYCRSAEAFQDVPFSYPYTYVVLDQAFPESKFILTSPRVRRGPAMPRMYDTRPNVWAWTSPSNAQRTEARSVCVPWLVVRCEACYSPQAG